MITFLLAKFKKWSFSELLFSQLEAVIQWIVMYLPAFPGMILRYLVYKLLFKSVRGFLFTQPNVQFVHMNRIRFGKNVGINSGCYLNGIGEIEIDDFVLIGANVTISSGMHPIDGQFPTIFERPSIPKKIKIGAGVWIGAGAVIMPGIHLARGTVVGAKSVVTKDTTEFSVVIGAPARIIKNR